MSADSDQHRPSFRFRDRASRLKDRIKDKFKDKAIKHNITMFVHHNLTENETHENYTHGSRHGFRQSMHHIKDVLKNKTHYESIKHRIKDKIDDKFDLHDNKTYPKGFYDSLFSPETENEVYLQTALICLWVIAVLCIIPTIIVIFLPAKKKKTTSSSNTIFFHVFLCELCYLTYVLLAMINVAKDFRLGSFFCDIANYGMYVTIPIMQFALLFLSLERLSKHFNLSLTWAKIFTKPYLIQVILSVTWIVLIALLVTFMFIKKQFSFNFIKDRAYSLAPPIVGDVVHKLASRRHHCSIDGRLSSVFKVVIIILFIILVVKPILFSLGFNLLTPYCCKKRRKDLQKTGDRRTTTLVTIFLLLNLFFSFPFYFVSMFNSVLTRIDSTKDTFSLVLRICFILRIINIIFECLAFYIFERNSWDLLRKLFYYGTCKKCPIFNGSSDDDSMYTKDPTVLKYIKQAKEVSDEDDDDDDDDGKKMIKRTSKQTVKSEPDDDDDDDADGSFKKKKPKKEKDETPVESDDDDDEEKPVKRRRKESRKQPVESDDDDEEQEMKKIHTTRRTSHTKKLESDDNEDDEPKQVIISKRKTKTKDQESDNEEDDDTKHVTTTKRKSRTRKSASDDDEDEEEPRITTKTKRKSHPVIKDNDDEEEEEVTVKKTKPKSPPKDEVVEEEEIIKKPKPKSHHHDTETHIPNGKSTSHRPSSSTDAIKTTKSVQKHTNIRRRSTPSPSSNESDVEKLSIASQSSIKIKKPSASTKHHSSSTEQKRTRTISPDDHHHRKESSPSRVKVSTSSHSHHPTKKTHHTKTSKGTNAHTKKTKKDRHTRILEMSDEV